METEPLKFDQWCILEIMGHQRFAGRVTEQTLGGASFLRIDIPDTSKQRPFTKLFSAASVYAITPTTEELARVVAESIHNAPIEIYDLPLAMQAKLRAPALMEPCGNTGYVEEEAIWHDDDEDDQPIDEDDEPF